MGKKQHSKDRMYLTAKEYAEHWGGFKEKSKVGTKPLPFYCCCLSLTPFSDPYSCKDGYVFDIMEILPWVKEHGTHPVTGKKMQMQDLIKVHFHKNKAGKFACPVTNSVFTDHTHIVFLRNTGNVFSYNAIKELNFKHGEMRDLLDGTEFTKKDIVSIQDPENMQKRAVSRFIGLKTTEEVERPKFNATTQNFVDKVTKRQGEEPMFQPPPKRKKVEDPDKPKKKKYYSTVESLPGVAASFTSTVVQTQAKQVMRELTEVEVRKLRWQMVRGNSKKKAYVRLVTNIGPLNFQIHCDIVPQTAMSFLMHCESGYYTGTKFHRLITSFMVQGGDPTGTGYGGECAWKGKLKDEFKGNLRHDQRGILSMANNGPDTGGSQFFILFGAQPTLDDKHTVFGELVGGHAVLNKIEMVRADKRTDEPEQDIIIHKVLVYANPFNGPLPSEQKKIDEQLKKEAEAREQDRGTWWTNPGSHAAALMDDSVGKYMKKKAVKKKRKKKGRGFALPKPKQLDKDPEKKKVTRFSDFSAFVKHPQKKK